MDLPHLTSPYQPEADPPLADKGEGYYGNFGIDGDILENEKRPGASASGLE